MKVKIKLIKIVCSLIAMVLVFLFLAKIKWSNPDMTDTRLIMTYWKEYIISIIVCIIGYLIISKECK